MKKLLIPFLLILLTATVWTACQKSEIQSHTDDLGNFYSQSGEQQIIPGQYIVELRKDAIAPAKFKTTLNYEGKVQVVKEEVAKLQREITGESLPVRYAYQKVMLGFSGPLTEQMREKLEKDPRVLHIYPDIIVSLGKPDKPGKPGNGGGDGGDGGTSQETPWGITRVNGGSDATGKVAWIIDSGIDLDHPDLNVNVAASRSFLSGKQGSNPDDQFGHGTHVAGTIAAKDNTIGVIGVAANATVISIRVLDRRGSGTASGVIAGIDYVGAHARAADVANMSLGGGAYAPIDQAVVAASGTCRFALAAGNESDNADNHSPARANGSNIYTVSAMTSSDNWASFSNYGNPPIDWCEPGVNIKSCWKNGGYNTISGTSMATPHLSGILLLGAISQDGNVSNDPDGNNDKIGVH